MASNKEYSAIPIKVDVSDQDSVQAMVDTTVEKSGSIDCPANTVGVGVKYPDEMAETSIDELDRFYRVNFRGDLLCLHSVTRVMRNQKRPVTQWRNGSRDAGRGVIVNLGSCNSLVASPNIVQYITAKHAVLGMTGNTLWDPSRGRLPFVGA